VQLRATTRSAVPPGTAGDDDVATGSPAPRRGRRWSRRRILLLVVLLLVLVGVALVLMLRPLLTAKQDAKRAQSELTSAKAALSANDYAGAKADIVSARGNVDSADHALHGFSAGFWASVPVFGGAVDDARRLVDALSQTTRVAQIGADVYPMVSGDQAQLVQGENIDLTVLAKVVSQTGTIGRHLDRAVSDLRQVSGSTPLLGGPVSRARDSALGQLLPVQDSYNQTWPLLKSLPAIVGAHGNRSYLLAMLNPAELRYSGGGALTFTTVNFINGQVSFGGSVNVDDLLTHGTFQKWRPVRGNTFPPPGPQRVTSSTFSPWWSVSGEELLRGFHQVYPQHLDGVIAVDLQALANLFAVTGPVDLGVPGVPPVTSQNLVALLANSYSRYPTLKRHAINMALIPAFRQKFFEAGQITKKASALLDSAKSRNFFTYFRDPAVEKQFAKVGLTGNLATGRHDYIGVFTQNTNGSKVDYWQHRTVTSKVQLHADGSATVHLRVKVKNQAPPYALGGPDPQFGYNTRYLGASLGVFLPVHAHVVGQARMNAKSFVPQLLTPTVRGVVNRPYFAHHMLIPWSHARVLRVTYRVPNAATRSSDGGLVYRFAADPQDTVVPEKLNVQVTWPAGYAAQSLPAGWSSLTAQSAPFHAPLTASQSVQIPLSQP
jgi:hypothetical protein